MYSLLTEVLLQTWVCSCPGLSGRHAACLKAPAFDAGVHDLKERDGKLPRPWVSYAGNSYKAILVGLALCGNSLLCKKVSGPQRRAQESAQPISSRVRAPLVIWYEDKTKHFVVENESDGTSQDA